jgi:hypothetical protein
MELEDEAAHLPLSTTPTSKRAAAPRRISTSNSIDSAITGIMSPTSPRGGKRGGFVNGHHNEVIFDEDEEFGDAPNETMRLHVEDVDEDPMARPNRSPRLR